MLARVCVAVVSKRYSPLPNYVKEEKGDASEGLRSRGIQTIPRFGLAHFWIVWRCQAWEYVEVLELVVR